MNPLLIWGYVLILILSVCVGQWEARRNSRRLW